MTNRRRPRIRPTEPVPAADDTEESADGYARRIAHCWQKSVASIIEAGRLLNEAKAKLEHGEFTKMKLPFSHRTGQMLRRIAAHPILSDPKHVSHLPPSWGTLYVLTQLPIEELESGLEKGTINPEIERKQVVTFNYGYTFERLGPSISLLLHFMQTFPDPEPLVDEMVRQPMGSFPMERLDMLTVLPDWITKLHSACQHALEEQREHSSC